MNTTDLGTEVEVAQEDGGLRAGDHQDQVNQEQEPIPILSCVRLFHDIKLKEVITNHSFRNDVNNNLEWIVTVY